MTEVSSQQARKANFRTRAGTGRSMHAVAIDARTTWGRRGVELYQSVLADLGGADRVSTAQEQLVRRLSGLCIIAECAEVGLAKGEIPSGEALTEYVATVNAMRRVAHSVGLRRIPKEVQDLDSYLTQRYAGTEIEAEAEAEADTS